MLRAYTCVVDVSHVKGLFVSVAIGLGAMALGGCAMGSSNAIDNSMPTGAISIADSTPSIAPDPFTQGEPQQTAPQTDRLLDEDTIRLAVTTANINKLQNGALPWANESTGSSGDIFNIQQRVESGQTCRSFEATRESYDGATRYTGDVCLDKKSGWWTRLLRPFGKS